MAYTTINFKTKKALKEALKEGKTITCYQPGPFSDGKPLQEGRVFLEGPHYHEPHRWYATGILKEGKLVKLS